MMDSEFDDAVRSERLLGRTLPAATKLRVIYGPTPNARHLAANGDGLLPDFQRIAQVPGQHVLVFRSRWKRVNSAGHGGINVGRERSNDFRRKQKWSSHVRRSLFGGKSVD